MGSGENKIEVEIVLDEALFGEFNTIAKQVEAKDWSNIFSVETVLRLVGIALNSGLLLACVVYFIKDKRLADVLNEFDEIFNRAGRFFIVNKKDMSVNIIAESIKSRYLLKTIDKDGCDIV